MGIITVIITVLVFIPQFCKCLVAACYVLGIALSDGNTSVSKFKQKLEENCKSDRERSKEAL